MPILGRAAERAAVGAPATVRITRAPDIQGEVTKNPNEAKIVALAEGLFRVNPNTRLSRSVSLEPGKSATIEYEYTLYVPS